MKKIRVNNIETDQEKRIYALGLLIKFSVPALLANEIIYLSMSSGKYLPIIITINLCLLLTALTYFFLYRKKRINLSTGIILILQSLTVAIIVFFYVGIEPNIHYYFLLFSLTPLALYSSKQYIRLLLYFVLNITLFIFAEYYYTDTLVSAEIPINYLPLFKISTLVIVMCSIAIMLGVFYYTNQIKENSLITQGENLKRLNRDLEESNATKEKFLGIIAHDLKNPLSNILGFSQLLVETCEKLDQEKPLIYSHHILEGSQQANLLINNLLNWSMSQSDKLLIEPEKISVQHILNSNFGLLESIAEQKKICLENNVGEDIYVFADNNMLDVTLRNIISNAIKFTPKQGSVTITAKEEDKFCSIHISDTGIGISKSTIKKLLTLNSYYTSMGTEGEKGTGMGLSLAKEFAEKNNGHIEIESELGKGTLVKVFLPLPS